MAVARAEQHSVREDGCSAVYTPLQIWACTGLPQSLEARWGEHSRQAQEPALRGDCRRKICRCLHGCCKGGHPSACFDGLHLWLSSRLWRGPRGATCGARRPRARNRECSALSRSTYSAVQAQRGHLQRARTDY